MAEVAGIYARHSTYLDRYVQIGVAGNRLISVSCPDAVDSAVSDEHHLLDRFEGYLDGTREDFENVELALTVPTVERRVLETIRPIPYGTEQSLAAVATATPGLSGDDAEDIERISTILSANPVPIVIPDHRVRDVDGAVPTDVRRKLRALEGLG